MKCEVVILAKSSKPGGFCVAGIDTSTGEWIRPVSERRGSQDSVLPKDTILEDGSEVEILDKIEIDFKRHCPSLSQPENYIYNSSQPWIKTGSCSISEVINKFHFSDVDYVFYNAERSLEENELLCNCSLLLLNISDPIIVIKTFGTQQRIQLNFEYNGEYYSFLKISDIAVKNMYCSRPDGSYPLIGEYPIVFSLTGRYDLSRKYYKMVAQIFDKSYF